MLTDAIYMIGVKVLHLLTGWLPTVDLGTTNLANYAAGAGTLAGCFIDLSSLNFAVGVIVVGELAFIVVRVGVWAWKLVR